MLFSGVCSFIASDEAVCVSDTNHLEIWDTPKGSALILCLDSEYLKQRHGLSMILGATYDFPDYKPHITLSYNLGAQYIEVPQDINIVIDVNSEVVEDLDLEWADDKV